MFKPRKFAGKPGSASSLNRSLDLTADTSLASFQNVTAYSGQELTKNENYCVSRLPAVPPLLESNRMSDGPLDIVIGYADNSTNFALAIGEKVINVWPYRSTDETPITFEFPIDEYTSDNELAPLAILTAPSLGSSMDPGLVIIGSSSGKVRFYESVQHAPAIGLISPQNIECKIPLHSGEYINLSENIDSAGVVVATTWKRAFLVCLRDSKGKPNLSVIEMVGVSKASRLFSFLNVGKTPEDVGDEIVRIKAGDSLQGSGQEIIIQDAKGTFRRFVHRISPSGEHYIDPSQTLQYNLAPYLENNIDGLIPGALIDAKFLDIWPLYNGKSKSKDFYTALVCVVNSLGAGNEQNLLLITFKIDDSGVLTYGSHQLPQLEFQDSQQSKPSLYIPKPSVTAFVVVGNTVIITDINTAFLDELESEPNFLYYSPRWEDVVRLKSTVETVGYGYEDFNSSSSNPGLIILTRTDGVIRIERFPAAQKSSKAAIEDVADPASVLKSHLRQAIFYQQSETLDFDIGPEYDTPVISEAVHSIVDEVLDSSSTALPPFFPSLRDSLITRANLLHELINFVLRNFKSAYGLVLPVIVEALEKLDVAHNLWTMLDNDSAEAHLLKEKVITIAQDHKIVGDSSDPARDFFTYKVGDIVIVVTDLIQNLFSIGENPRTIIKLLVNTLYSGIFKNEADFIYGNSDVQLRKLWIYDTQLLVNAEAAFSHIFALEGKAKAFDVLKKEDSVNLVNLVETFYYLVTTAIQYMQETADDQLQNYIDWYRLRRKGWISILTKHRLNDDALYITEKYQDFSSIASILENGRQDAPPELIDDKLHYFLDTYGYEFTSKLFDFYIKNDKIPQLLLKFDDYENYLERYFEENAHKSAKVAWIHYIKNDKFSKASQILMTASGSDVSSSQENNELTLSLAKLTAIASKVQGLPTLPTSELDEIATEAENALTVARAQNKLRELMLLYVQHKKELLQFDYFLENFVNPKYPKELLKDIEPTFKQFVDQAPLPASKLIQFLTVVNPLGPFKGIFVDALEVASSIDNDSDFKKQAADVWLKLIALTDDWPRITATNTNTDEINKSRVQETLFYYTISQVKDSEDLIAALNSALEEASYSQETVLLSKVHELMVNHNVLAWLESIKADVKKFAA